MCGLAGIVHGNKQAAAELSGMLDAIKHRGPDDFGTFIEKENKVLLGSRRLSILDLSEKGKMPMFNADKSVVVCQNGEIYNYFELKELLQQKGYTFISNSDTEAIVHGYEEWGEAVFQKLQGMFAISIYDAKKDVVLLGRDRIGIKPLYYLEHNDSLYFSSEVKSFKYAVGFSFKNNIDIQQVNKLLGFMFLPDNEATIISGVKKLPAGHFINVNLSTRRISIKRYWELPASKDFQSLNFEEAVNQLEDLLLSTVESHLMSDVPLGVLLSGGLDSSLLTALVKKVTATGVQTFTAKFDHKFNESTYAWQVANYLNTKHTEIFIDPKRVNASIDKVIDTYDDLTTFDGGLITTKILCEEIKKQGITVLLLGEGADEIFGGYSWFGLSQLPFSLMPRILQSSAYYYAISRNGTFKSYYFYKLWYGAYKNYANSDVFKNVSATELFLQLPNHLLMKVDKASMAESIEARVPYLDHKLVEFVYNLPREFKLKGAMYSRNQTNEKHILREVAKRYLPKEIVYRKKRGFMLPMSDVLEANIDRVRAYVTDENSLSRRLLSKNTLNSLFNESGFSLLNMQREYLLWRLFLLETWYKKHV